MRWGLEHTGSFQHKQEPLTRKHLDPENRRPGDANWAAGSFHIMERWLSRDLGNTEAWSVATGAQTRLHHSLHKCEAFLGLWFPHLSAGETTWNPWSSDGCAEQLMYTEWSQKRQRASYSWSQETLSEFWTLPSWSFSSRGRHRQQTS